MDHERAIEELKGQLRSIIQALPGFVLTLDREHRIIFLNRTMAGRTPEQAARASVFDLVPPVSHGVVREALDSAWRTGQPVRYEAMGLGADGAIVWHSSYVGPTFREGAVVALTLSTEDITQRKQLESELRDALERRQLYAEELERKNLLLAEENAERERTELIMRAQQETLRAMSAPIIQAWEGVLALPVIGALDSARAQQMMEKLLAEIARTRARFSILDLTGLDEADAVTVDHLLRIVRAASLLGSRCLVSGISPTVARTMVEASVSTEGAKTFGLLQDALRYALLHAGEGGARAAGAGASGGPD